MSKQLPILTPGPAAADGEGACCTPLACEPLSDAAAGELAPLFKALADPVRLRLLSLIACHEGGEACVCDLTDAFELTAPTISHHLKVLKQAGLVDSERRGTWVYYWLNPGVLERLSAALGSRVPVPAAS
ncbi:ArsR/SmtB family transcription factor [Spirillospora sp. CA-128828]|uniref:ArsR/SmtB family transcription factor n=1 Tax=Spirillospora sp. CA-128828 TaxID=3240033 RepID=UPI003D90D7E0